MSKRKEMQIVQRGRQIKMQSEQLSNFYTKVKVQLRRLGHIIEIDGKKNIEMKLYR